VPPASERSSYPPPVAIVLPSCVRAMLFPSTQALKRSWRSGFIFFCRHDSFRETFERQTSRDRAEEMSVHFEVLVAQLLACLLVRGHVRLDCPRPHRLLRMVFGLARHQLDLISQIDPGGTAIFLFDQTFRYLHGVYDAASPPGLDIDPNYLRNARGGGSAAGIDGAISPFPAQVRVSRVHDFQPLEEKKFCHLVTYNAGTNIFRHRLAERETVALLHLLVCHPLSATGPTTRTLLLALTRASLSIRTPPIAGASGRGAVR